MRVAYIAMLGFFVCGSAFAAPDWSYDADATGQDDWGNLEGYSTCTNGTSQSPITISYTSNKILPPIAPNYTASDAVVIHSDKSFEIVPEHGGSITDGNETFELERIALHSPSEHVIKESFAPLEMELIHKSKSGKILIVSVFANTGEHNGALDGILTNMRGDNFNAAALLPADKKYFAYEGSLTTPPCTEHVAWRVLKTPISISKPQLEAITKIVGRNARLPQPVYMRTVLESN